MHNTHIPYLLGGGALEFLANAGASAMKKALTKDKMIKSLEGLQKNFSRVKKGNKELADGLKKLLTDGEAGFDEAAYANLQKIAKQQHMSSEAYKARKAQVEKLLRYRKQAQDAIKRAQEAEAKLTGQATAEATAGAAESAAESAAQANPGILAQATNKASGLWGGLWSKVKAHPYLSGALALGLTNGTTRSGLGTALSYWTTPYSQWDNVRQAQPQSSMQLRMADGSIVPVTMGTDGVLSMGSPTATTATTATPDDAALDAQIAQAIAQSQTPTTSAAPTATSATPSTSSYISNANFNDLFEDDSWDD